MDKIDPTLLAGLDQSMAAVDDYVTRYVGHVRELMAEQGKQGALVQFGGWLQAQDMTVVAALATGALIRLAEQIDEHPAGKNVHPSRSRPDGTARTEQDG